MADVNLETEMMLNIKLGRYKTWSNTNQTKTQMVLAKDVNTWLPLGKVIEIEGMDL